MANKENEPTRLYDLRAGMKVVCVWTENLSSQMLLTKGGIYTIIRRSRGVDGVDIIDDQGKENTYRPKRFVPCDFKLYLELL